jgi:hypothetical protein
MPGMQLPNAHPTPAATGHAAVLKQLEPQLARRLQEAGCPRGVIVVELHEATGRFASAFSPPETSDVPHFMALGLPEESATSLVEAMRTYDPEANALILVLEQRRNGEFAVSVTLANLKRVPNFTRN